MIDLKQRSVEPELLDLGVAPEEAVACLRDLRLVNRWLGGRSSLRAAVLPLLGTGSRLLDAGCGSGDLLADLGAHIHHSFLPVGLDIKPLHLKQAPHQIRKVVGDSRALPFPDRSFDVVAASLFLHHFDPHEVAGALTELARCARRALVINDLRRAWLPYAFGRVVFPLIFRSRISVDDGLLSIRRGFTRAELEAAFRDSGIGLVHIQSRFPYRLVAIAKNLT